MQPIQCFTQVLLLIGTVSSALLPSLAQEVSVQHLYPDKARYLPGDAAVLTVEIANPTPAPFTGTLTLRVFHLDQILFSTNPAVSVSARATSQSTLIWTAPGHDFRGYLVEAALSNGSKALTALDLSSHWKQYPRYGYITEFFQGQTSQRSRDILDQLARNYHINALQFYDWMWRHENVIQTNASGMVDPWIDWRGAGISYAVLTNLVGEAHRRNIAALPYFQIYCALDNYQAVSGVLPQWGLFADTAHAQQYHHSAGSLNFWVFNPAHSDWQNHLLHQYTRALLALGWDGIHLDQLGNIGAGHYYDYNGNPVDLGENFSPMINRSKEHLESLHTQYPALAGRDTLTFNIVDGGVGHWGVHDAVHHSRVDFLYSEIWAENTYEGVHDFIRRERAHSGGKAMVLAAYMNYDEENGGLFDLDSVCLANAAFFASGAFHLELGDGDWMASKEFLPSRSKEMPPELKAAIQDYYHFSTAYESLLFAPEVGYGDAGVQWVSIPGRPISVGAGSNAIWCLTRRTAEYECLHLINLLGNDSHWRNVANTPPLLTNLTVCYRPGAQANVESAYLASPDFDHGTPHLLPSTLGWDDTGRVLFFTLPSLRYWDMIFIKRSVTTPWLHRYEAEDGIKYNVSVNNNYPGYSGSGFVDHFGSSVDSVSFFVLAPTDNDYEFQLRYANATGTNAARMLLVDGDYISRPVFPPLPDWSTWGTVTQSVRLTPGVHQVVLVYIGGSSNTLHFDYLQLAAPTHGLKGEYFDDLNFVDPQLARTDPNIDFNWGAGSPAPEIQPDRFSVRWTGQVQPEFTEPYTFYTLTDDGVRLWINGHLLLDRWTPQAGIISSNSLTLVAGQKYDVRLEYFEQDLNAAARLLWASPSLPRQVVPTTRLFPPELPSTNVPPAPVALTLDQTDPSQPVLTWAAMPGATGYVLRRASGTNSPYATIARLGRELSFTHPPLPSGTWCFVLTSLNAFGESAPSEVLQVEIPWTDTDDDGMSDANERFAGTDPDDAGSLLKIQSIERFLVGTMRLTWLSVPGKVYRVVQKNSVQEQAWAALSPDLIATRSSTSWVDPTARTNSQRMYRIQVLE